MLRPPLFGVDVAAMGGKRSAGGRIDKAPLAVSGGGEDRFGDEFLGGGEEWRIGEENEIGDEVRGTLLPP